LANAVTLNSANTTLGGAAPFDRPLTLSGAVTLTGISTLAANGPATLSGNVGGAGALIKGGTSTLTLGGSNSYAGATQVTAGTLLVNGSQPGAVAVTGGTLGGTGSTGLVATAGQAVVSPGSPAGGRGTLSASGANFSNGGSLTLQLAGYTTPGVDYDR